MARTHDLYGNESPKYKRTRKRVDAPDDLYSKSAMDIAIELGVSLRTVYRWRAIYRYWQDRKKS